MMTKTRFAALLAALVLAASAHAKDHPAKEHGGAKEHPAKEHAGPAKDHSAPAKEHAAPVKEHAPPAKQQGGSGFKLSEGEKSTAAGIVKDVATGANPIGAAARIIFGSEKAY